MPAAIKEDLDLDDYKTVEGFIPSSDIISLVEQGWQFRCDEYTARLWHGEPMLFYGNQPIKCTQPIVTAIGDEWFITRAGKLKRVRHERLPFESLEKRYHSLRDKEVVLLDNEECYVTLGQSDEEVAFCEWFNDRYFTEFEERIPDRWDGISLDLPDDYHPLNSEPIIRFETIVHNKKVKEIYF